MTRYLVTAALPYANGPIHLGHLAGAYLPADIYVRYMKQKGEDVLFICGSDEHGVPITLKAENENKTPQEIVDYYHNMMKENFTSFGINFDNFSQTSRMLHHKNALHFFTKLNENGYLEKKTQKQYYCNHCKRFLPDRYVEGECPHCHFDGARGDQCDNCGKVIDNVSLLKPKCKICGGEPDIRETEHFYLKLEMFEEKLKKWLSSKEDWKSNVREFALGWIKEGLKPRAITRDLNWGVKIPHEGYENKVLYVWFDAPIGYISSTMEWAELQGEPALWEKYWKDKDTKLIHFLGKDNIVFHSVIWPSMLMGVDEDYVLPADIPANEYLNIEGQKLSTSRNTAIWLKDYLQSFPPDLLRYSMAMNLPESRDSDFSWKDFQTKNNSELADILGNFINRTIIFIQKYRGGKLSREISLNETDREFFGKVYNKIDDIGMSIEQFKLRKAAFDFMDTAREANKYFTVTEPWTLKDNEQRLNTVLYVCLKAVSILVNAGEPFIPFTSDRVRTFLKMPLAQWDEIRNIEPPLDIGTERMDILFRKIEDAEIEKERAKIGHKEEIKEDDNLITFDDFKKAKLTVAKILTAEKVKKADRLLKLHIDIGSEERTIVAGIAEHYSPDEVIGKNIVIVENLQPAKIRGIESRGMLLAASDKTKKRLSVLFVDENMAPGDSVG